MPSNCPNIKSNVVAIKRLPLTSKKAIELLLNGGLKQKVCRYCLHITYPLSELDQIMQIVGNGALYKVTIRDIVASFHPFKVENDPNFPSKICEKCLNKAIQSYLFAQQCEKSERALRNCFDDIYEKFEKLDSIEHPKKRGRQKLHPNYNVIRVEHHYVTDYAEPIRNLINVSSVSLTPETPVDPLECKKCWQVLPNIESLANHEKIHPKTMWFHCRMCGKSIQKKYQMSRHLGLHAKGKLPDLVSKEKSTVFFCKQCEHSSENYDVHLQHIEKHKFKMVLDHLVNRKMDKLCSICLDKSSNLIEMDKMICLHGGYPELTGDRTLYNILGSTVPEPNHKYQELQLPNIAKIMSITKKFKKTIPVSVNNMYYDLSLPRILSNEKYNYDGKYLFIFSEPESLDKAKIIDLDEETDQYKNNNEHDTPDAKIVDESYMIVNADDGNAKKTKEKFSNSKTTIQEYALESDSQENVNEAIEMKIAVDVSIKKACKVCWVFNKPMCKECKGDIKFNSSSDTESISNNIGEVIESKSCQYCWVFKKVDVCEYCKQPNTNKNTDNNMALSSDSFKTDIQIRIDDIDKQKRNIEAKSDVLDLLHKHKAMKRKIEIDDLVTLKKTKWLCKICLTTNQVDREMCICCDSKEIYDNNTKINFGCSKDNFFQSENSVTLKIDSFKASTVSDENENELQNMNQINAVENHLTEKFTENPMMEIVESSNSAQDGNFLTESNETMEIGNEDEYANNILYSNTQPNLPPVPIEFDIQNIITPINPIIPSFSQINPAPLQHTMQAFENTYQFCIGSSKEEKTRGKKFKKHRRFVQK